MSIDAYRWTYRQHPKRIEDGKVTDKKHPAAKLVLLTLADFVSKGQSHCWPSQALLADLTDMTERQVRRCLSDLEVQGLIARESRRRKDGSRRSDRLVLNMSEDDVGRTQDADEEPDENDYSQPDERAGRDARPTGREWSNQPDESSGHEPTTENRPKNKTSSLTNVREEAGRASPPPAAVDVEEDLKADDEDKPKKPVREMSVGERQSYYVGYLHRRLKERELLEVRPLTARYKKRLAGELREHIKGGARHAAILFALDTIVHRWNERRLDFYLAADDQDELAERRRRRADSEEDAHLPKMEELTW